MWMTTEEAATYVKKNVQTVERAARAGRLQGYQAVKCGPWRFQPEDLDNWVKGKMP